MAIPNGFPRFYLDFPRFYSIRLFFLLLAAEFVAIPGRDSRNHDSRFRAAKLWTPKLLCVSLSWGLQAVPKPGIPEFALRGFPGCFRTSSRFVPGNLMA